VTRSNETREADLVPKWSTEPGIEVKSSVGGQILITQDVAGLELFSI